MLRYPEYTYEVLLSSLTSTLSILFIISLTSCAKDMEALPTSNPTSEDVGSMAQDTRTDLEAPNDDVGGDASVDVITDTDNSDVSPAPTCVDMDNDGFPGTGDACVITSNTFDCDDTSSRDFPGAPEFCDLTDNDCDGEIDEGTTNSCGGCGNLTQQPGQVCGDCGRVVCDGTNGTRCAQGLGNICGGCEALTGLPGDDCGSCGLLECAGGNSVTCNDLGLDQCGGCNHDVTIGSSCGTCGQGQWACSDNEKVCSGDIESQLYYRDADNDGYGLAGQSQYLCAPDGVYRALMTGDCRDDDPDIYPGNNEICDLKDNNCNQQIDEGVLNACGGCAALTNAPGVPCSDCGEANWQCAGFDQLNCVGQDNVNACGGCSSLSNNPGQPCGDCGSYQCNGTDAVSCNDPGTNNCGGCSGLNLILGSSCGDCGEIVCNGINDVNCSDPGSNVCGGCAGLSNNPGQPCGDCGSYQCNGINGVTCSDPGQNACGGCETLSQNIGATCGSCGTYTCDGLNSVTCTDPGLNACGGCLALDADPGSSCGSCGNYVCNGYNLVSCTGNNVNACGGCAEFSGAPGDSCGDCGQLVCEGVNTLSCSDTGLNACGGCTQLSAQPGTSCGDCGTVICNGLNNTSCNDSGFNTYYVDADRDGFGTGSPLFRCSPQGNADATVNGDCNDGEGSINPDAIDICDGVNNNCNTLTDENPRNCGRGEFCSQGDCICFERCANICCEPPDCCSSQGCTAFCP